MSAQHPYAAHDLIFTLMPNLNSKVVLDVGCGKGVYGYLMRSDKGGDKAYLIGIDIHPPRLMFLKKYLVYDELIRASADWLPFRDNCANFIFASEVIEHLPKARGLILLKETERICNGKVMITTPNGFLPTPAPSTQYETHWSSWKTCEFKKLGYTVYGYGFKWARHVNPYIGKLFRYIFTPISFKMTLLSEFLIAVKQVQTYPKSTFIV